MVKDEIIMYSIDNKTTTEGLLKFLKDSPSPFHAVEQIADRLNAAGFTRLQEVDKWQLTPGKGYYVTRNGSSIIAFAIPQKPAPALMLTASHTDSPTYKLKNKAEMDTFGKYTRIATEGYGGMLHYPWFDRPLSVAGRLVLSHEGKIETKTVYIDKDILMIPSVAPHMKNSNSNFTPNVATDMVPLFGGKDAKLRPLLAEAAGVAEESIVDFDLYLTARTPGVIWGANDEFYSSPRIDNLQCAYGTLMGFLTAGVQDKGAIGVYSVFDNEETGSGTKQGAGSLFLRDTLERLCEALGYDLRQVLASSMFVSADNGHARHPNHPELSDGDHCPHMNEGVVLKANASQKYTTDGLSAALFREICARADVPVQVFYNRSDMGGGSTLGSIANRTVAAYTVDIGMAQLAMHSVYETGGVADTGYMIRAIEQFYRTTLVAEGDGVLCL